MFCTEVRPIGTALPARRTVIGRQCNSVKTAQPGDRTTNPGIVMPERYESSQRVDSLARVVITPVRHTHPATKCILRYWIKIENSSQSKLLFQCLLSEKKLCYDGIPSWFTGVQKLIKMVDENCKMIHTKDDIKTIVIKLE